MLKDVWGLCKWKMVATYSVLIIESVVWSLFPYFLGKAIDGLLVRDWYWFLVYVSVGVIGCNVGCFRRMFDTRIFGGAWKKVSSNIVCDLMRNGVEVPKIITRAGLSTRFVDFFEYAVPQLFRGVLGMVIALIMLWRLVPGVIIWLVVLVVITILISILINCCVEAVKFSVFTAVNH